VVFASFEDEHREVRTGAETVCKDTACSTSANDHNIGLFESGDTHL
jgi:hypothetical protein